jgi:hypothetical protein
VAELYKFCVDNQALWTWSREAMVSNPLLAPLFPAGKEPLPPGLTEDDRAQLMQEKQTKDWMTFAMESCVAKTILAGGGGTFVRFCGAPTLNNRYRLNFQQALRSEHFSR